MNKIELRSFILDMTDRLELTSYMPSKPIKDITYEEMCLILDRYEEDNMSFNWFN